jgi:hypothetical protein
MEGLHLFFLQKKKEKEKWLEVPLQREMERNGYNIL